MPEPLLPRRAARATRPRARAPRCSRALRRRKPSLLSPAKHERAASRRSCLCWAGLAPARGRSVPTSSRYAGSAPAHAPTRRPCLLPARTRPTARSPPPLRARSGSAQEFGWCHLSAGDLLRAERATGSPDAELINNCTFARALIVCCGPACGTVATGEGDIRDASELRASAASRACVQRSRARVWRQGA